LFGDVLTTAVDTAPPPPGASRETSRDSETGGMPRSLLEHVVARAAGGVWARPGGGGLLWRLLVLRGAHLLTHDETRRPLMRMLRSAVAMTTGGPAAAADVGMSGYTEMLTDVSALFNVSHTHTYTHAVLPKPSHPLTLTLTLSYPHIFFHLRFTSNPFMFFPILHCFLPVSFLLFSLFFPFLSHFSPFVFLSLPFPLPPFLQFPFHFPLFFSLIPFFLLLCPRTLLFPCPPFPFFPFFFPVFISCYPSMTGGSVAEWLACWTQAQKGLGSNHSHDAVG